MSKKSNQNVASIIAQNIARASEVEHVERDEYHVDLNFKSLDSSVSLVAINAATETRDDSALVAKLRDSLNSNMRERAAYETSKSAHECRDKLARYLRATSLRVKDDDLETSFSDSLFLAAIDVVDSFDFINDSLRDTNRFNVYAIEKVAAKLIAISNNRFTNVDATANKYCLCVLADLLHNKTRDSFVLDRKRVTAIFSNVCAQQHELSRQDFVRKLRVQASTATTQASSSLRALAALNVLSFDESRKIVSRINYDHVLFKIYEAQYLS
jgi:hypothetical protein